MWYNQGWDESRQIVFNAAKKVYARENPAFTKADKGRQRKRLQRQLDNLDEE